MEYVTRSELQDLFAKNEENRYNLKALWHNVNLVLHDLKPRVERAYISINGNEYDLLENPPVVTEFPSTYIISIQFDSGWGTYMECYFSQTLNRDQSRQFLRQLYTRFRSDLACCDRRHMLDVVMENIEVRVGRTASIEEAMVVIEQELKGHIRNRDIQVERAISKRTHGRYGYLYLDGERVSGLDKIYYLHSDKPHWTFDNIRSSIDRLLKKIYK